ncbi:MAG: nuclear transport factor 2 family protein [Eubacteriales bacterium]|nr:nuclear transport factor 2 family protein [Eubacteriales bacterium]
MRSKKQIAAAGLILALSAAASMSAFAADYTVQKNDSLWKIAREQLGNGERWNEIYTANKGSIRNPDVLRIGQVLNIPGTAAAAETNAQADVSQMSQTQKALALINTFTTGDTETARSLLKDDYIQHNLDFGSGADAFVNAVAGLAQAPVKTTVNNIRAFEDGDYVFLQTVYNFAGAGEQVAFDVFRFEDGKVAEHWDNLAALAAPNPSGHTQIDGTTEIKDLDKTTENKELVMSFVRDVLMGNNPDNLTSYFDGNNYIQHNSGIADGLDGLNEALAAYAAQGINMVYNETHLLLGQGNYVLVASEGYLGDVPTTYYDLFRVENGKIAEHWDVMETLKDQSQWANQNGKF